MRFIEGIRHKQHWFHIGSGAPEPHDFHIRVKGDDKSIGSVSDEPAANHIPVSITHHKLDPDFVKHIARYAHMSGAYRKYAHGTLRLKNVRQQDVHDVLHHHMAQTFANLNRKHEAVDRVRRLLLGS